MGWFSRSKSSVKEKSGKKKDIWVRCDRCKAHIYKDEWQDNLGVCSKCNFHSRMSCRERLNLLIDEGSFHEMDSAITPCDPLKFVDGKGSYAEKVESLVEKTGNREAVLTGHGKLHGRSISLAIMDFKFLGGSLGSGTGEKILRAANYAHDHDLPYLVVSASGGARMHEGVLSLMQMAKTCAGIARLNHKKLPYISLLTDPTAGGVSASFAMMGDVNIAEPGALIAFAGRRVIEQTIKQKLPDNFQTAEYLLEHGFIDLIVGRKDLKNEIHKILDYYGQFQGNASERNDFMEMEFSHISIQEIELGSRVRRDVGDLSALESSIRQYGLLFPLVVNRQKLLISGYRRIEACKRIGLSTVPVLIADVQGGMPALDIECQENLCRKELSMDELDHEIELKKQYIEKGYLEEKGGVMEKLKRKLSKIGKST